MFFLFFCGLVAPQLACRQPKVKTKEVFVFLTQDDEDIARS